MSHPIYNPCAAIGWAPTETPPPYFPSYNPQPFENSSYPPPPQHYNPPSVYPATHGQGCYRGQPSHQYEHQQNVKSGGGTADKAGKMLGKVGLGGLASKIPGGSQKGHSSQGGQPYYPQQGYPPQGQPVYVSQGQGYAPQTQKSGHSTGAMVGTAAAAGVGGLLTAKALKKGKKKNIVKYGVPIAGVALGVYALKKVLD